MKLVKVNDLGVTGIVNMDRVTYIKPRLRDDKVVGCEVHFSGVASEYIFFGVTPDQFASAFPDMPVIVSREE